MVDIWAYIAPVTATGNVNGRPVGVTQTPGGNAIHQAQLEAVGSRRVFHTKGTHGIPADFEELFLDGEFVYRAIDTSRPARDGGPYTLHDAVNGRGSKWAKRHMNTGEVFERNPFVSAFDIQTGLRTKTDGPVRTWLRLHAVHTTWRGVADVIELWWLTDSPAQTTAKEKYFYGRGLGLVGFEGPGLVTYPNHVWASLPPAAGVPVLTRRPLGFSLPALPDLTPPPPEPPPFRLLYPLASFVVTDRFDAPRSYGKHEGDDFATVPPGDTSADVRMGSAGVVESTGFSATGYGNWVRVRFDADDGQWRMWYGHLSRIDVSAGQRLNAGDALGKAGSTGNSTGVHVHATLTHPTRGLDGYVVAKVVNPAPFWTNSLPTPPPPPPAPQPEPALWEWEFDTEQQKQAFGDFLIRAGQGVKAAPGRQVYVRVETK